MHRLLTAAILLAGFSLASYTIHREHNMRHLPVQIQR
jgi:hypothetical protein